jgi:hypothetical protein
MCMDPGAKYLDLGRLGDWCTKMSSKYSLGEDIYADIKRLPKSVKDLQELSAWLASMSSKLVSSQDAMKKNGELRTYKNIIIALHAIRLSIGALVEKKSLTYHAATVMANASNDLPENLSEKAAKLWHATFGLKTNRIRVVIVYILSMAIAADQSSPPQVPALESVASIIEDNPPDYDKSRNDSVRQLNQFPKVIEEDAGSKGIGSSITPGVRQSSKKAVASPSPSLNVKAPPPPVQQVSTSSSGSGKANSSSATSAAPATTFEVGSGQPI